MSPGALKFKVDENLPREVAEALAAAGYDALTVEQQGLSGRSDDDIENVCRAEGRVIVTCDLGFADIRRHPPEHRPGAVVLRLRHQETPRVVRVLAGVIQLLDKEPLAGRLWVVDESGIRVRGGDGHV